MNVIICDDDKLFAAKIEGAVQKIGTGNGIDLKICVFNDPIIMCNNLLMLPNTIFILDIDMPGMTGFDVARHLKEFFTENYYLFFISGKDNFVFKSFTYHPFCFIRKAEFDQIFQDHFLEIKDILHPARIKVTVTVDFTPVEIYLDQIRYIEADRNYLCLHLKNKVLRTRLSVAQAQELWSRHGFVRIHSGILVNIQYIKKISYSKVILKDDFTLPISRSRIEETRKRLMEVILNEE